jgi:hypothetical protein
MLALGTLHKPGACRKKKDGSSKDAQGHKGII